MSEQLGTCKFSSVRHRQSKLLCEDWKPVAPPIPASAPATAGKPQAGAEPSGTGKDLAIALYELAQEFYGKRTEWVTRAAALIQSALDQAIAGAFTSVLRLCDYDSDGYVHRSEVAALTPPSALRAAKVREMEIRLEEAKWFEENCTSTFCEFMCGCKGRIATLTREKDEVEGGK